MAISGDMTVKQDGGGTDRLHPHLIAFVRWCMSYLWSSTSLFLHRLMSAPLPALLSSTVPAPKVQKVAKVRPASRDHLHPEPLVECEVLYQPIVHDMDIIFVHGLYGSLGNTWRQGDWRSKYKIEPDRIPLRRSASIPTPCDCLECKNTYRDTEKLTQNTAFKCNVETNVNENRDCNRNKCSLNEDKSHMGDDYITIEDDKYMHNESECKINESYDCYIDNEVTFENLNEHYYNFKRILKDDDVFITEKFYNNTIMNQVEIIDNYELQANFVRDLFELENKLENENGGCDSLNGEYNDNKCKYNEDNNCKCKENAEKCEPGCGCCCDECYSPCWPRDWLSVDYPTARVLSINYTSDPHLWRPLWVKGTKRLRLQERAEQMIEELLRLDVGLKPVIWVGHSKGGLFIKQIYCEAYEAYLLTKNATRKNQNFYTSTEIDINKNVHSKLDLNTLQVEDIIDNCEINLEDQNENLPKTNEEVARVTENHETRESELKLSSNNIFKTDNDSKRTNTKEDLFLVLKNTDNNKVMKENEENLNNKVNLINVAAKNEFVNDTKGKSIENDKEEDTNVIVDEEINKKAKLWLNSSGFMFYSVPHRGSPLADIKTPITARSIELLEMGKDCALVLSLQDRWLQATSSSQPLVRSLVETCRTLMSVLWLRIVSVDSADAGIGALCGVSVDHREICKPTSRHCLLYTELLNLINAAINKCNCR